MYLGHHTDDGEFGWTSFLSASFINKMIDRGKLIQQHPAYEVFKLLLLLNRSCQVMELRGIT